MTGRLVDMSFSLNRKQRITLEVDSDFRNLWDKLNLEKKASRTRNATTLMKMPFLSVHLCRHLTRCLDCRTTAL